MDTTCLACGGACCSFRTMAIALTHKEEGQTAQEALEKAGPPTQFLRQDGTPPDMEFYDDGDQILFHCNHRTKMGLCGIYDDRPQMCRDWECQVLKAEEGLDTYLEEHGDPEYEGELEDVTDEAQAYLRRLPGFRPPTPPG